MTAELIALVDQLQHACAVAYGDLIALGMPVGASTGKLLQEAIDATAKQFGKREQAAEIANDGDLVMPDGLSDAGRRAHEIIVAYFKEHDLTTGGAKTFWAPSEWTEEYGTDSHLIVAYSGSMRAAFSMDAAYELDCDHYQRTGKHREPYALYEGMQERLRAAGLYFEEQTLWYSAVYSVEKP